MSGQCFKNTPGKSGMHPAYFLPLQPNKTCCKYDGCSRKSMVELDYSNHFADLSTYFLESRRKDEQSIWKTN